VVDRARQGELGDEEFDRGSLVGNCCCSDDMRVHPHGGVHCERYIHPRRCPWQGRRGLCRRGMAFEGRLVDRSWCLSCDGSWLQLCGCFENTHKKEETAKEGGLLGTDV
jgi:hypothetical protein